MTDFLYSTLARLPITDATAATLRDAADRMIAHDASLFARAVAQYYDNEFDAARVYDLLHPVAEKLHIPEQTANLLFIVCAAQRLQRTYAERGYDAALFDDFLADIVAKGNECMRRLGVFGITTIAYWYPSFFSLKMFALGRLQYELYYRKHVTSVVTVGGHDVLPTDMVYYIHIPSVGPLTKELCMDSYRRAHRFFRQEHAPDPLVFYCSSWLLYERNREFMDPSSNILRFMSDFKITNSFADPTQKYWGIFDMPYEGDASALPRNTSLQRRAAAWLENGGVPGGGEGYFLFDGEQILNE